MFKGKIWAVAWMFLMTGSFQARAQGGAAQTNKASEEDIKKEVAPVVKELNKELEQRIKALEASAQSQAKNGSPQSAKDADFQLTVSRGVPEKGFMEKYSPILFPSVISLVTLLFTYRQQVRLAKMSQENQQQLQGLTQKNQQEMQSLAQAHQEKLQREARWGVRQLEAAQEVWSFVERTVVAYGLGNPNTKLSDAILGIAPGTLLQTQKEIGELTKKQGFFLPKGSGKVLFKIRDQLDAGSGSLNTIKTSLEEIRQQLKEQFDALI